MGTPRQVPKIAQKALRGALSGPGPKSTPVNGGRDRKPCSFFSWIFPWFDDRASDLGEVRASSTTHSAKNLRIEKYQCLGDIQPNDARS